MAGPRVTAGGAIGIPGPGTVFQPMAKRLTWRHLARTTGKHDAVAQCVRMRECLQSAPEFHGLFGKSRHPRKVMGLSSSLSTDSCTTPTSSTSGATASACVTTQISESSSTRFPIGPRPPPRHPTAKKLQEKGDSYVTRSSPDVRRFNR